MYYLRFIACCLLLFVSYAQLAAQHIERKYFETYGFSIEIPSKWQFAPKNFSLTNTFFIAYELSDQQQPLALFEALGMTIRNDADWQSFLEQQLQQLAQQSNNYGLVLDANRFVPNLYLPYQYLSFKTKSDDGKQDSQTDLLFIRKNLDVFVLKASTTLQLWSQYSPSFERMLSSFRPENTHYHNHTLGYQLLIPPQYSFTVSGNEESVEIFSAIENPLSGLLRLVILPNSDEQSLNQYVANEVIESMMHYNNGQQIPIQHSTIGDIPTINFSYQANDTDTKEEVFVKNYYFQRQDMVFLFSLSCKTAQKGLYERLLEQLLSNIVWHNN